MINDNTRVIDCTVKELREYFGLSKKEEPEIAVSSILIEILSYIKKVDVVTNPEYCRLRGKNDKPMPMPTLLGWFKKGCPREDSRHVSIKAVDEWARNRNTRKAK